jgi:hypothetical protein
LLVPLVFEPPLEVEPPWPATGSPLAEQLSMRRAMAAVRKVMKVES